MGSDISWFVGYHISWVIFLVQGPKSNVQSRRTSDIRPGIWTWDFELFKQVFLYRVFSSGCEGCWDEDQELVLHLFRLRFSNLSFRERRECVVFLFLEVSLKRLHLLQLIYLSAKILLGQNAQLFLFDRFLFGKNGIISSWSDFAFCGARTTARSIIFWSSRYIAEPIICDQMVHYFCRNILEYACRISLQTVPRKKLQVAEHLPVFRSKTGHEAEKH